MRLWRPARSWAAMGIIAMTIGWTAGHVAAQTSLPSLAALDHDTRELLGDVNARLVRVQVPVRIPIDHPLVKWRAQLDPKLREKLDAARARGESPRLYVEPSST